MDENKGKTPFSSFFTEGQFATQTEKLAVMDKTQSLSIGIPKETTLAENRVALVPNSIRSLAGYDHNVIVEKEAGLKSHFTDMNFSDAGAEIANDRKRVFESDIIVKITPPTMEELQYFKPGQTLIAPLHLPYITDEYIRTLLKKKVTAIAMEYLQAENGSFPIVRVMSELAGMCVINVASELLSEPSGGRGVLLGGVSGVPPAKVVILGAGVVGEFATKAALGLGASVRIFDNDISKLMRIQSLVGQSLHTSTFNPVYLGYQLMSADVLIGAVHSDLGRTPIYVTESMVEKMKEGSVIIDVSIDQGGCVETSKMTTLDKPTFKEHGVIHYCVPNIPSRVPRTASVAISNIITGILIKIGQSQSMDGLLYYDKGIRHGVYTFKGCLTNKYLGKRFGIQYRDIGLLLTSNF